MPYPSWDEYLYAIIDRFGAEYDYSMVEVKLLTQMEGVIEYQNKFDSAMARLTLSNENIISCFITGLKPEIRDLVKAHMPFSLPHSYQLVRMHDFAYLARQKSSKAQNTHYYSATPRTTTLATYNPPKPTPKGLPEPSHQYGRNKGQRLTPTELNDKRLKVLCYFCYEKFFPGHKCKTTK